MKKTPTVASAMDAMENAMSALVKRRTLRARSGGFHSRRRDSLPAPRGLMKIPERGRAYVREAIANRGSSDGRAESN